MIKDALTAGRRTEHPKDATRPQISEAPKLSTRAGSGEAAGSKPSSDSTKATLPKPLTPGEKIKAITHFDEAASTSDKGKDLKLNLGFNKSAGCLPTNHRANKAPAKQELELCHGRTSLRNVAVA